MVAIALELASTPRGVELASLVPGDSVVGDFLLTESERKVARTGQPYWRAKLMDERGSTLGANLFADLAKIPPAGTVVRVEGAVEKLGSGCILKVRSFEQLDDAAAEAWLPRVRVAAETLEDRLQAAIDAVGDLPLHALLVEAFGEGDTLERFLAAPAATRNHSARVGGLALHSLAVRRIALEMADALDGFACDVDLLAAAALLHDVGKVDELELSLTTGGEPVYTVGQLQGHIVHGVRRIERAALAVGLPKPLLEHLIHMVVAHHGTHAWGSPVVPMTPEAVVLHVADYAASRLEAVLDAGDGKEGDAPWTPYSHALAAKVYLGFDATRAGFVSARPAVEEAAE